MAAALAVKQKKKTNATAAAVFNFSDVQSTLRYYFYYIQPQQRYSTVNKTFAVYSSKLDKFAYCSCLFSVTNSIVSQFIENTLPSLFLSSWHINLLIKLLFSGAVSSFGNVSNPTCFFFPVATITYSFFSCFFFFQIFCCLKFGARFLKCC